MASDLVNLCCFSIQIKNFNHIWLEIESLRDRSEVKSTLNCFALHSTLCIRSIRIKVGAVSLGPFFK